MYIYTPRPGSPDDPAPRRFPNNTSKNIIQNTLKPLSKRFFESFLKIISQNILIDQMFSY